MLSPQWVTGLSDGEASFTYSHQSQGNGITNYYAVKLTRIERPMLERLQQFFGGVGTLYDVAAVPPRNRSGLTKSSSMFRVSRIDELALVVAHFDQYPLQTTKRKTYQLWRLMVLLKLRDGKHADPVVLHALAEEITRNAVSKQSWR